MKAFIEMAQVLETGIELVGNHLRWIVRNAVTLICPLEAINQIAYVKDMGTVYGNTSIPLRGIAVSIETHIANAIDSVQDADKMHTAFKLYLLRDIIDTAIHEAYHINVAHENGIDFSDSTLEEDLADESAFQYTWQVAKHWNIELASFGEYIDDKIEQFMKGLEEDQKERPEKWRELQLHMYKNNLIYYDGEHELSSITEAFKAKALSLGDDPETWEITPLSFEENTKTIEQPPTETEVIHVNGEDIIYDDEIPMDAIQLPMDEQPAQPSMNLTQMEEIVSNVMRRMFYNILQNCGATENGLYTNPEAVTNPINIADIPGATDLFVAMDTVINGHFVGQKPIENGNVCGIVSQQNLPSYVVYMKINGQLHKRALRCANPNAVHFENGQPTNIPTTFAERAKAGDKIVFWRDESAAKPGKASLELKAGMPIGTEEFKIWS